VQDTILIRTILRNPFLNFLRWCPGAIGLYLRQKIYPRFLGKCGSNVLFDRFVNFHRPHRICIGNNSVISKNVTLDAGNFKGNGMAITIGEGVFIGIGTKLSTCSGRIIVQSGSSLGSFCRVEAENDVTIGQNVLLAAYCAIGLWPTNLPASMLQNIRSGKMKGKDIFVGAGCWLGVRSYILPGVCIGEGCIIGAHAYVHGTLPEYIVAVGQPAEIIRNRKPDVD